MAIKWGSTLITTIKWSNTICTAVYWGSTKVFPIQGFNPTDFPAPFNGGVVRVSDNSSTDLTCTITGNATSSFTVQNFWKTSGNVSISGYHFFRYTVYIRAVTSNDTVNPGIEVEASNLYVYPYNGPNTLLTSNNKYKKLDTNTFQSWNANSLSITSNFVFHFKPTFSFSGSSAASTRKDIVIVLLSIESSTATTCPYS